MKYFILFKKIPFRDISFQILYMIKITQIDFYSLRSFQIRTIFLMILTLQRIHMTEISDRHASNYESRGRFSNSG